MGCFPCTVEAGGSAGTNTAGLCGLVRCGTLTFNTQTAQHKEACFKQIAIAVISVRLLIGPLTKYF